MRSGETDSLKWSATWAPKEGEKACGDLYFVKEFEETVILAAIDGLGHGEKAFHASEKAKESLEQYAGETLLSVINRCHKDLQNTRGVVMSLAQFNSQEHTMSWASVGNVEGRLIRNKRDTVRAREELMLRGGVVGYRLPSLQSSMFSVSHGDLVIFITDGVRREFLEDLSVNTTTQEIGKQVAVRHFKGNDDALVLAARYRGK